MKRLFFAVIACFLVITFALGADDERQAKLSATTKIGFSEAYNPQPGFTLSANFSKMKQYINDEFGINVVGVSNWSYSQINDLDIIIIPAKWQTVAPNSHMSDLKTWIKNGGCLIFLYYPMNKTDPDKTWGHLGGWYFGQNIFEPYFNFRRLVAADHDARSFANPFGNTPYTIFDVNGTGSNASTVVGRADPPSKFIAWNAHGEAVGVYNPSFGSGKVIAFGNYYWWQNSNIDLADNKNFLFNVLTEAGTSGSGGGGGGGGGSTSFIVKKAKGKPKTVAPGNDMKVIGVVLNKSNTDSTTATKLTFFLSLDKVLDGADFQVGQASLPALGPGQKKKVKMTVEVPAIADDYYYVIAEIESNNENKASKKQVEVR